MRQGSSKDSPKAERKSKSFLSWIQVNNQISQNVMQRDEVIIILNYHSFTILIPRLSLARDVKITLQLIIYDVHLQSSAGMQVKTFKERKVNEGC